MFKVKSPKAKLLSGFATIDGSAKVGQLLPPPSLSSTRSHDELEDSEARREIGPMVPVDMTYDDEFAPSSATLSIGDPTHLETKGGRLFMYNHHLIGEGQRVGTLEQVMLEAEELGCPRFPPPAPLLWIKTSEEECHRAAMRCAALVQNVEEHSEEWLILNCYMNAVFATDAANKGASVAMIGEYMFLLGATLRELELVRRNKRDALRGKSTVRAAAKGGKMQNAQVSEQTHKVIEFMATKREEGASVSDAARWAFQANLGSSAKANRVAWYRRQRKL
ncbi:MAG: hypothetical protein V7698_05280 [Paracoccaceae bacterium]